MRRSLWIALGLTLVLALGAFAAACGGGDDTTTTVPSTATTSGPETTVAPETTTTAVPAGSIKIGIAISLTGASAAPCEQIKQGFDTEAKFINAHGGINGRQVELVYVDDQ
jgi:ABC-type branched-subunit amino acid transport system substrate-binding protein